MEVSIQLDFSAQCEHSLLSHLSEIAVYHSSTASRVMAIDRTGELHTDGSGFDVATGIKILSPICLSADFGFESKLVLIL